MSSSSSSPRTSDNNNDNGQHGTIRYEFIYFNTRGAGEFCRLLLAAFRFDWRDLRYPIRLANGGWAPGGDYMAHQREGQFVANLDRLPILNVVVHQTDGAASAAAFSSSGPDHHLVLAKTTTTTIGQSHAIGRYLWRQHLRENHELRAQLSDLTLAQLDCVCECVRDIRSAWYQAKAAAETKRTWFVSDLTRHCERLEACIAAAASRGGESAAGGPFLIPGCTMPSIADVAIYHLLGTPVSLMTGSVSSFMDNEGDRVIAAYGHLPRLKTIVTSVSNLPSIRRWEEVRPDTFS